MPDGPYGSNPLPGSPAPRTPMPGSLGAQAFVNQQTQSTQPTYPSVGGSGDSVWSKLAGFLGDHWDDLLKLGIGAFTTKEALQNSAKANEYTNKALDMAGADYESRAPFREAAAAKLGAVRPDLSRLIADPGNPYKRQNRGIPVVGGGGIPFGFVPTPGVNGWDGPPQSATIPNMDGTPNAPQPLPIYREPMKGPIRKNPAITGIPVVGG